MTFKDILIDKKWNIDTAGRDEHFSDEHHYPYEPTSYSVLERLVDSGLIGKDSHVVDYGCGKGRVLLFLHHETGCDGIGVECVKEFYDIAIQNALHMNALADDRGDMQQKGLHFIHSYAEKFVLPDNTDNLFFFNPFSIEIMEAVMQRILESYYEKPRRIRLFFYYPQDEYIAFLMSVGELSFYDEIDCMDLFPGKVERNKIMIFEIEYNAIGRMT